MSILNKKHHGFTLMELMIVVAIVGILAAVTYPSYKQYVDRGKRAEARAALLDTAARQERWYSDNNSQYTATITDIINDPAGGACTAAGVQTETCLYTLTATTSNSNQNFVLTAAPQGWTDTLCGNMTITHAGARTESGTGDLAACWGK